MLGPGVTDAQVFFTGSISSFSNNNLGAVLHWQDSNDWYKAYINGTQLVVQKRVQGVITTLAQVNFTANVNTHYDVRFQIVGPTLTATAWISNTTEPSAWMITTTDSSLTSGQCGLRIQLISATSANITSFEAINPDNGG